MSSTLVVPSIPYLSYSLFSLISKHPLFVESLVLHPVTQSPIGISIYRFMDGFPIGLKNSSVACCIIPASAHADPLPSAHTYNVSALYKPFDLGHNHDEVIYHMGVKFYYQEVTLPGLNIATDPDLIKVPQQAALTYSQTFLTSNGTTKVQLEVNPGYEIIGNYLELTRLALIDTEHTNNSCLQIRSIEVVHQNLPTSKWDSGTNVFLQHGSVMLRITAFVSRGWRDKLLVPVSDFNLSITDPNGALTQNP